MQPHPDTTFCCNRDDMVFDDGEPFLELVCCLFKVSADDPLGWHFVELTMCFISESPLLTRVLAAPVWGSTVTAKLLSAVPLSFGRPRYVLSFTTLRGPLEHSTELFDFITLHYTDLHYALYWKLLSLILVGVSFPGGGCCHHLFRITTTRSLP